MSQPYKVPPRRVGGLLPPSFRRLFSSEDTSRIAITQNSPEHWHPPQSFILRLIFTALCLVVVGAPDLERKWESVHNTHDFEVDLANMKERIVTVTVVAGLILSSTAALVTTPPPRPDVINYIALGPYTLLFLSLTVSLGGLIVGSIAVYVFSNRIGIEWFRVRIMGSRLKVFGFLFLIGYPFVSIGVSTSLSALGLLIAAFNSSHRFIQVCSALILVAPTTCAPIFCYLHYGPNKDSPQTKVENIEANASPRQRSTTESQPLAHTNSGTK